MECQTWITTRRVARQNDIEAIKAGRQAHIRSSLLSDGWGETVTYFGWDHLVLYNKIFREPTRITPRNWLNIQPKINQIMQELTWQRIDETVYVPRRRTALTLWSAVSRMFAREQPDQLLPCTADVVQNPAFRAIIELPEDVVPQPYIVAETVKRTIFIIQTSLGIANTASVRFSQRKRGLFAGYIPSSDADHGLTVKLSMLLNDFDQLSKLSKYLGRTQERLRLLKWTVLERSYTASAVFVLEIWGGKKP
ncbi:hypothetical protein HGRIS_014847 [Hohenbuehelia grisea]|uniref:Uncharacterized protein n=1 Tax=Hohenbuehelia grisea TaxID=104357 RepID=A0ABR3IQW5_9AGAR